jgi:hypothetical protein
VELASIRRPLTYITEEQADELYPTRESNLADRYIIVGSSLTALPLSANDIELTYYQAVPTLTSLATTNWLMTALPNIPLRASLFMAAEWIKDTEETLKQAAMLSALISSKNKADNRAKMRNAAVVLTGAMA